MLNAYLFFYLYYWYNAFVKYLCNSGSSLSDSAVRNWEYNCANWEYRFDFVERRYLGNFL